MSAMHFIVSTVPSFLGNFFFVYCTSSRHSFRYIIGEYSSMKKKIAKQTFQNSWPNSQVIYHIIINTKKSLDKVSAEQILTQFFAQHHIYSMYYNHQGRTTYFLYYDRAKLMCRRHPTVKNRES